MKNSNYLESLEKRVSFLESTYLECEDDAGPLVSKYRSLHLLNEDDSKDDDGVIRKVGNKWKILKKNRKDYWDADYKTKKDAEAALRAYWANKH